MQRTPNFQQSPPPSTITSSVSESRHPLFKWVWGMGGALAGIVLPPLLLPTLTFLGGNIRDAMITQDYRIPLSYREVKSVCQAMFGHPGAHRTVCFSPAELQQQFHANPARFMPPYKTFPQDRRITIVSNKFVIAKCYGYQTDLAVYRPCLKFATNTPEADADIVVVQFSQGEWGPIDQAEASRTRAPFIAVSGYFSQYDANLNMVRFTDGQLERPIFSGANAIAGTTPPAFHGISSQKSEVIQNP